MTEPTNNPNETPLTAAEPPERIWVSREYALNPDNHRQLLIDDVEYTRHQPPAVPLDGERTNLARQIQQMYRERSQPLMTHEPPFESLLGLIVDAALTTTPAGWQPIETAPKDGTTVLLVWHWNAGPTSDGSDHKGVTVVAERWYCRTHAYLSRPTRCPNEPDCKMNWGAYGGYMSHWMPLPAVPNVTATPAVPLDADAITHAANLLFNGTTLECDGNELRSDGTCAKCERVNQRIMAKFSPVAIELLNETFPETTNAATGAQTCVDCAAGIPKNGGYLHDLTPQLANDETHTYRKCANAPAKAELTAAPTSGAIAAAKEWFQETRQAIEDERPRTSKSFTEAATANLDAAEQKLAAIISRHLPPEAPSISAAIAEVERLRDEYESGYEHYAMSGAPTAAAIYKLDAANEILEALRTLQPSTPVDKETDHAK